VRDWLVGAGCAGGAASAICSPGTGCDFGGRNLYRCSFPVWVRGSESTNSMTRGYL
jgi:hypothetical protein